MQANKAIRLKNEAGTYLWTVFNRGVASNEKAWTYIT